MHGVSIACVQAINLAALARDHKSKCDRSCDVSLRLIKMVIVDKLYLDLYMDEKLIVDELLKEDIWF